MWWLTFYPFKNKFMIYLVLTMLFFAVIVIRKLVNISLLLLRISKAPAVSAKRLEEEYDYQFIKGLY